MAVIVEERKTQPPSTRMGCWSIQAPALRMTAVE
jgi:hypothetical protein